MKNKIFLLLSFIFFGVVGYVFRNPLIFGVCNDTYSFGGNIGCSDDTILFVGEPMIIFFLAAIPSILILLFSKASIIDGWWRFARWWLALSVVVLVLAPAQGNGIPIDLVLTKERAAWLMGGLFGVISLIVIAMRIGKKQ